MSRAIQQSSRRGSTLASGPSTVPHPLPQQRGSWCWTRWHWSGSPLDAKFRCADRAVHHREASNDGTQETKSALLRRRRMGRNRVRVVSGTPITDAQRALNEANADSSDPRAPGTSLEGIPHGTTVILQSTGEGDVFLFEGREADPARRGRRNRAGGISGLSHGNLACRHRSALGLAWRRFLGPHRALVTSRVGSPPDLREPNDESRIVFQQRSGGFPRR